jgi:hypothetical protein
MSTCERSTGLYNAGAGPETGHQPADPNLRVAAAGPGWPRLVAHANSAVRAFVGRLFPWLGGSRLRDFRTERTRLGCAARRYLGLQAVPLKLIVGSVDRSADYDAAFRPKLTADSRRTARVRRLMEGDYPLPAVELLRLGHDYYVLDGHHRVVAAKQLGREFVDAEVTDYPLPAERDAAA